MNDQSDPNAAGTNAVDESLSMSALIGMMEKEEAEPEQPETTEVAEEATETEEAEEVDDTTEETEEEEADEAPEGDSRIDLDNLTPEQWETVRTELKSKAAKEFPEYRRKLKERDDRIAQLESQLTPKTAQPQPAESPLLAGVENAEQLAAKVTELQANAEAIEALLDDHEGYAADDIIELGTHSHKKSEWKHALRNIRKTLDKAVPYKQHEFQQGEVLAQQTEAWNTAARKQVPEIDNGESEVGQRFKAMLDDPLLKEVRQKVPGIAPQLEYLLAHACRSLFGDKGKPAKVVTPPGTTQKAKPPASPAGGVAAGAVKPDAVKAKRIEAAKAKYEKSGSKEDLVALELAEQS